MSNCECSHASCVHDLERERCRASILQNKINTIVGIIGPLPFVEKYSSKHMILWAHLVSEHAVIVSFLESTENLVELHNHEHEGPGTIRNHDLESRAYSLKRLGQVLSESDS